MPIAPPIHRGLAMRLLWLLGMIPAIQATGASVALSVGAYSGPQDAAEFPVQVLVDGSASFSEMVGAIQISRAGLGASSNALPRIVDVRASGSLWSTASGGSELFYSLDLGASLLDPNIALKATGQSVKGPGVLFTVILDLSTAELGDYVIALTGTDLGDTTLALNAVPILTTSANGALKVVAPSKPDPEIRLSLAFSNNSWAISFKGVAGARYSLERRPALGSGGWTTAAEITAPAGSTSISFPIVMDAASSFFHVVKISSP
ncbi:MAG: hypothetical protein HYR88_17255 [Verrucomicrobia bacterium]|nr:hypothetical protein [Verrucomicrobiota bacterium]